MAAQKKLKKDVGAQIVTIRRDQGVTQEALAEKLGVSTQWLSRVENGHENVTVETMVKVAKALKSSVTITLEPRAKKKS